MNASVDSSASTPCTGDMPTVDECVNTKNDTGTHSLPTLRYGREVEYPSNGEQGFPKYNEHNVFLLHHKQTTNESTVGCNRYDNAIIYLISLA